MICCCDDIAEINILRRDIIAASLHDGEANGARALKPIMKRKKSHAAAIIAFIFGRAIYSGGPSIKPRSIAGAHYSYGPCAYLAYATAIEKIMTGGIYAAAD